MIESSSAPGSKPSQHHSGNADPRGFSLPGDQFLGHITPIVTAVLVDAGFFLQRAKVIFGSLSPEEAARRLHRMSLDHLNHGPNNQRIARLYRVFVYDAPPAEWKGHLPVSKKPLDLSKTPTSRWRKAFHQALLGHRKVALRLGEIPAKQIRWELKTKTIKELLAGKRTWDGIVDDDFQLDIRQKGVDMRLGLDIASLAYQKQVNQIVLVSGDSDFVPAAKFARREGIDFILDPMWATIRPQLFEHIDGLRSVCRKPPCQER